MPVQIVFVIIDLMLIKLRNLRAGYGGSEVLKNLSLFSNQDESVVLIGPNGAGKSMVLKSIMGLAEKKTARFFGKVIQFPISPRGYEAKRVGFCRRRRARPSRQRESSLGILAVAERHSFVCNLDLREHLDLC